MGNRLGCSHNPDAIIEYKYIMGSMFIDDLMAIPEISYLPPPRKKQ